MPSESIFYKNSAKSVRVLFSVYESLNMYNSRAGGNGKREFITIRSKLLTERYLKEFDIFWNMSTPDKKKKGVK